MTRGQSAIVRMLAARERMDPAAQLLLAHGAWMEPQTLPMEYRSMPLGLCFKNAQQLAQRRRLRYVEGMAVARLLRGSLFPMEHGWCLDADGRVIDPTWARCESRPDAGGVSRDRDPDRGSAAASSARLVAHGAL